MSDHSAQIKQLEEQIAEMRKQDAEFAALQPEYRLAITLHKSLCHHNHTDGCGWEYEGDKNGANWLGHAHSRYLLKARRVMSFCDKHNVSVEAALGLIEVATAY
jgi:hypothetical protein